MCETCGVVWEHGLADYSLALPVSPASMKRLSVPVYQVDGIGVVTTEKEWEFLQNHNPHLRERFGKDWNEFDAQAITFELQGRNYYMLAFNTIDYPVLCHESVHMAQFVLEAKGIESGVDNTEVLAYLTEYIFTELEKLILHKND